MDLQRDLNTTSGNAQTAYARSHLVICSRAAGIEPPIDSVFPRLDDDVELQSQAEFARSLGFFGKSAIHPRQLPVLHEVFTPSERELAWAREVLEAFDAAGGAPCSCRTASSSTGRWRSGHGGCCSSRRPFRGSSSERGERRTPCVARTPAAAAVTVRLRL